MTFEPIAIVGRACQLPGAATPDALWNAVAQRQNLVTRAPADRWGLSPRQVAGTPDEATDRTWSELGGYVDDPPFDAEGYAVPAAALAPLDPLFHWLLRTGRDALREAGLTPEDPALERAGAVVGNLSFPTSGMARQAERAWLGDALADAAGLPAADPRDRFMSGYPAHLLAQALGLGGAAFCLDAACASSLVAIKIACDRLHSRDAELMLAGAVSRADDLFIHIGFCALNAMSKSGQSRPFHRDADGLVPAEGAGFVALMRLSDAEAQGRAILGVIRGVGLSNDGRSGGLLAPSQEGQVRAMTDAYASSGWAPGDVDYVECHATGTPTGDRTELLSMRDVFGVERSLPIGSLKSNLGHLITAAGVAGLLKVLSAFENGTLPPTRLADDAPRNETLGEAPFRVVTEAEPWPEQPSRPRRAAISAFGFGGNNAHLLVEAYRPGDTVPATAKPREAVAVVGLAVRRPEDGVVTLPVSALRFPPRDLEQTLPQQLLLWRAALDAIADLNLPTERTGVIVGMGCDPNIARYGARWRMPGWARQWNVFDEAWIDAAQRAFTPSLQAAGVLGTMPNIVANRINAALGFGGASLSVSGEEVSGLRALTVALDGLNSGELDAAVVGAVDLSRDPVHEDALRAVAGAVDLPADDAAVVLVLQREADAVAAGHPILARIDDLPADGATPILRGGAHAAQALVAVADAVSTGGDHAMSADALGGQRASVRISAGHNRYAQPPATPAKTLAFPAHLPPVALPPWPKHRDDAVASPYLPDPNAVTELPRAPELEPIAAPSPTPLAPTPTAAPKTSHVHVAGPVELGRPSTPSPAALAAPAPAPGGVAGALVAQRQRLAAAHQQFLAQQAAIHQQFLDARGTAQQRWSQLVARGAVTPPAPAPTAPASSDPRTPAPILPVDAAPASPAQVATPEPQLPGFTLDREGLMVHAGGPISEIYGDLFKPQDAYERVTRMPLPPLLLADRMTGIDAEAGVLSTGSIWTETDVREDSWYLHDGRMPGGLMIESGQADLMLISYMGIDLLNRGERIYRLLGCELTYHGPLPQPGETLKYDIHVDGHAAQGDVRLFFFHYDCHVGGERRLSVRSGQAGFFTDEELADSAGILWTPETGEHCDNPRLDPPPQLTEHRSFSNRQLRAFSERQTHACFGAGFEKTLAHTRTPAIAGGRMLFVDEVTHFEPEGGPWKRGYLRAVDTIEPDDWFFEGHFHNDPCMPGTLMFEGCLQTMAIYLAALGFTIERDGWRFEPVPEEKYLMRCRGQVTPTSKELIYEVFIEEVIDGDTPTIYADLLCTVDGLGAFHCRRMGLRLVPDWPMNHILKDKPEHLSQAPGEIAEVNGFRFDHDSLLACAWGRPSRAFGPVYEVFDSHRKVARLPGPPYHFMTRIAKIDAIQGGMQPGGEIEVEYDIPADAWYFDDNGARTMPYAVLLEAALQPCGWLASFVGSALTSDIDLAFRNLDGTGTLHAELFPASGTLRTRSKIVSISSSAGMIIESFEVQCFMGETLVYEMDTVFGFFPQEALDAQVGLPVPDVDAGVLEAPCEVETVDLKARPKSLFAGSCRLASPFLMMIDRVTGIWPEGGAAGLGKYRAEKDVDPGEWFFKAHFFQDPVQPGSLGIEAMVQLLQFAMLDQGMDEGIDNARFEPLGLGTPLTWKYRGQVRTHNTLVHSVVEITETGRDERGSYAIATASLWVDGMRIYEAKGLGMRIVSGGAPDDEGKGTQDGEEQLEPTGWLADHCPTFTVPALPMMSMVDRLAGAAKALSPHDEVVAIDDVQVERWLPVARPVRLRTEIGERHGDRVAVTLSAFREAPRAELSRFEPVARGMVTLAARHPAPSDVPELAPLEDAAAVRSPYDDGALFHGPAFHKLLHLSRCRQGASARLDARPGEVPFGTLNQVLLDAATHPIPHDALHVFSDEIGDDQVAYPYRIPRLRFFGPTPSEGEVDCEVRFAGFDGDFRFPAFEVQLRAEGQLWCAFRLVEILLPKGPLGTAPPAERRTFLRDRQPVAGLGLSQADGDSTRVTAEQVKASNWLPGTIESVYALDPDEDSTTQVAVKDHIARRAKVHPSTVRLVSDERGFSAVSSAQPLTRHPVELQRQNGVSVRSGAPTIDLAPVRRYWDAYFGIGSWPVEDLYYSLIERFVRRVHVAAPDAFESIRGRGILYLANHQVAIESLLFSIVASGLNQAPTVTLAKAEHRTTWLGKLIQHCFSYPGIADPQVITYFDRSDPTSLPLLIDELARDMSAHGKSVMVHVEGTRSLSCREPVLKMTSKFVDMALATRCPVVPVRFVGGLPAEPLRERIEFPIGHGKQDIYLGAPIFPEDFEALPYKERKHLVIDGINALGPSNADEQPFAGDAELAAKVGARVTATDASPEHATLFEVLAERDDLGPEAQSLIDRFRGGIVLEDNERGYWMAELARRLYGAKGPSVTIR